MFVEAIELAAAFTRPIHSIIRNYKSDVVQRSAATLFFVNKYGHALTCAHVADLLAADVTDKYLSFKAEKAKNAGEKGKTKALAGC